MVTAPFRPGARDLTVAWAACAAPRLALFLAQWPNVRLDASSLDFPGGRAASDLATPLWPPAYEAMAELLWRIAGQHPFIYGLELIAVHALVGVAVLWLARALSLSARASWLAVAGVALLPYYVATAVRQVDVGAIVAVSALAVAVMAEWWASGAATGPWTVGVAVAAGLWFLARAEALGPIALLFILAWWLPGRLTRSRVIAATTTFVLLLVVWSGVNFLRFGHFTPVPAHGGYHLWVGNRPGAAAELWRRDFNPTMVAEPPGAAEAPQGDAYATDAAAARAAWAFIVSQPSAFLRALPVKIYRYWDPQLDEQTPHTAGQRWAYTAPYVLYLPLAIYGATRLWRRRAWWPLGVLTGVVVGYWAPHVLVYGLIRHRMTVEWALMILAAVALDALLPRGATAYSLRRDD